MNRNPGFSVTWNSSKRPKRKCLWCQKTFVATRRDKKCCSKGCAKFWWMASNPDKTKELQKKYNRRYYLKMKGVATDEVERALEGNNSVCGVCKIAAINCERSLSADHDHETGRFRGYLCGRCNMGLGQFRDNPKLLQAAMDYLRAC